MRNLVSENIEVLRARAERYRLLARELFDRRVSEEAASLARELDEEIARLLQMKTDIVPGDLGAIAAVPANCH